MFTPREAGSFFASLWDADILIWAASQLVQAQNTQQPTSRRIHARPYDILGFLGRGRSKLYYDRLRDGLDRLKDTRVTTSLGPEAIEGLYRFRWIDGWREARDRAEGDLLIPGWARHRPVGCGRAAKANASTGLECERQRAAWALLDRAYSRSRTRRSSGGASARTAGFRSSFGRVLRFDPTNRNSSAYNPLLEVRKGEWEVRDVQNVADVLVDPEGSLERRNHWEKTSHSLLVGAILHVLYAEKDKTLAGVAAFLSNPTQKIEDTLDAMMTTAHLGEAGLHPVVASAARELKNKSDNERSGVLSTAMSFLGLYRDPVVAHVTRQCDWRIADLVEGNAPTTLYLVVPPSDISRTKPLIRLLLNQIGRRLTEDIEQKNRRRRLLLMLDEFPALGRLDFFESALAFMAGYGLKAFLIAQSLNQIEKAYGSNNSILDNCHVRVSFATNDERTAKRVSDALGTATETKAMKNYAGHRLSPWLGHLMVSRSEIARPLLTPGEIMQLPPDDEIVMVAGAPPKDGFINAVQVYPYSSGALYQVYTAPGQITDVALLPIDSGVDVSKLQFRYEITGDTPPWRPLSAFDDGAKVYIEMPRGLSQGEAPPFFVIGSEGEGQLVNYRVRKNYYIVDRLFAAAELRLRGRNQQTVRITRKDGGWFW